MEKLMVIDGNSIVNRAFYGIRPLSTKEGIPTNAIYGFLNIMLKELETVKPDYLVVAFDKAKITFRNRMFEDYKAGRSGMPDDLATQMPYLKEVLSALNISYLDKQDFEADDIIGTISKQCEDSDIECYILTGDRDDLQLCSKKTFVLLITTKGGKTETVKYDDLKVLEKYEVTPKEFIDLKGLMGDTSDNIPGVKGVGEVTAKNLIKEFKSIENLYDNIDSDKIKKSVRTKLQDDKDMAFLSKDLATIIRDVPLDLEIKDTKIKEPKENVGEVFEKLEFSSFLKRLNIECEKKEEEIVLPDILPLEEAGFPEDLFYLINEDTFYININEKLYGGKIEDNKDLIKKYFESPSKKYTYGAKEHYLLAKDLGVSLNNLFFDAKIALYILDPALSDYRLETVTANYGKGSFENFINCLYNFRTSCYYLYEDLEHRELLNLYKDIELPLIPILSDMQYYGMKIDKNALSELSILYEEKISDLTKQIEDIVGEEFNINSTKQLSDILFNKLGLKPVKKTKTGFSTDNSVLEALINDHPVIPLLINYRAITKLKSTYVDGIMDLCDNNSVLHSKFHQTVTQTGRLSSSEPNLQNIPVRTPEGRKLRKLFIPHDEDKVFVSADYSQVELRVLAQICGDSNLIDAFMNNEDIHTQAASKIFDVDIKDVIPSMRATAKTVNFGILYGKTEFTLAKDLNITRKKAKEIIDTYLNKYPGIKNYMSNIIAYAKENGYVKTLLGRTRFIKELSDRNFMTRKAGERIALNTPIQGTAADIMKIAMIRTKDLINKKNIDAKIVLQIHDELVIECYEKDKEEVKNLLCNAMENAVKINVPLSVSVGMGKNLYELK